MNIKTIFFCSLIFLSAFAQEDSPLDEDFSDERSAFKRADFVEVPPPPSYGEKALPNDIIELDIKYVDPPSIQEVSCWWENEYRVCYRITM